MLEKEFEEIKMRLDTFEARTIEDLYTEESPLVAQIAVTDEPVPFNRRESLKYRPIAEGHPWGRLWQSCWIHLTGTVPQSWEGVTLAYRINIGGEGLLFGADGEPFFGITNTSYFCPEYLKEYYIARTPARGGQKIDLWVEGASNGLFGAEMLHDPHPVRNDQPAGGFNSSIVHIRIARFNEELWHLRFEFKTLHTLLCHYSFSDYRARKLVTILNNAYCAYRDDPRNAAAARAVLKEAFAWPALGSALTMTAVGHAHIDVGWLWPVRESIRKAARTFASQLELMERYDDYVFGASQPQLYQFVKDNYPGLYSRIAERVKEGRWELQGGMWVEPDCNITSGESLVRQFLHGKNFFKDEFGVDVRNLWIPDVFGYAANLPQIIKKAGCDFFLTQKISWNRINHFPYNTFRWRGIDGTEVVTHFPPEDTYNSNLFAGALAKAQDNFEQNNTQDGFACLFGIGDGGGGPSYGHVECGRLCRNLEGTPKVKFATAQSFFDSILAGDISALPHWVGELYLEMHRGTLTTQARTKRNNRKLEQLLSLTEFVCSMLPAAKYPRKELDKLWKCLLINQFHDILPGSSIRMVYENTEKEHGEMFTGLGALLRDAGRELLQPRANASTLVNPLSWEYRRPVELPKEWADGAIRDEDGNEVVAQVEDDGRVVAAVPMPPGQWKTLQCVAADHGLAKCQADSKLVLENDLVRYEFAKNGLLLSAQRKSDGFEFLHEPGNVFTLYADHPIMYDAWDIDPWYTREAVGSAKAAFDAVRITGPVRSILRFSLKIGSSAIDQEVSLAANSMALEFKTAVDWHENRRMLRVAFPTAINSDQAVYDVQYGYLKRPTHSSTSWDAAKFECCGQRYVDLNDQDNGVALLNDCKYGHHIHDNVIDLNLLRSPKYPDYFADQGLHTFVYAFLPHSGDHTVANAYAEGAQLNRAPWRFDGLAGAVVSPVQVFGEGISLEVVKRAEKSDDIILRIVETRGRHAVGEVVVDDSRFNSLSVTNLMEWTDEGCLNAIAPGHYPLALKPFEILTLKLK